MDYVVGSIAELISGNVTPNRPKIAKRALTPTKHMPSPNVTPKSEFVNDRSIFMSPTTQKRQAIVKKSPKRIFQSSDLDVTTENEGNLSTTSPKADKVRKHLKNELESKTSLNTSTEAAKSPKKKHGKSAESLAPRKNVTDDDLNSSSKENLSGNELTPKKKKKPRNPMPEVHQDVIKPLETFSNEGTPKKKKKQNHKSASENNQCERQVEEAIVTEERNINVESPKKKKKKKNKAQTELATTENEPDDNTTENSETKESNTKKKNRKRKNSKNKQTAPDNQETEVQAHEEESKPKKIKKIKVNPNAVTDKDSDSEHESDDEIESENEENNKQVLETPADVADNSSDEEEAPKLKKQKKDKPETEKVKEINTEDEIKRTLFVGNVLFSNKCKKEIKKIFLKYGEIESVRIRTVPVKNPSVSPKVAVIKEELHPERSTVNVYVKFADPKSVDEALSENNTVLNGHHLRVSRSGSTGAEHDPRRSIFVGNMPFALEDDALREKFSGCGEIESVRIVRDKKTNAGKGFGYVNFASKDGVELALALTEEDLTIKNRIMRVKRCTQATQRQLQKNSQGKRNFQQKGFHGKKPSQGDRQRNMQGNKGFKKGGTFQSKGYFGNQDDGQKDGAYRRVMKKRKSQEAGDGPPPKRSREGAPREKKPRKEFVGMTAEKKKKHKFDKGQKKKKALSEILTKYNA